MSWIIIPMAIYMGWLWLTRKVALEDAHYWAKLHYDLNDSRKRICVSCGEPKLRYYPTYSADPKSGKYGPMAECLSCGECHHMTDDKPEIVHPDRDTHNEMIPFLQWAYRAMNLER